MLCYYDADVLEEKVWEWTLQENFSLEWNMSAAFSDTTCKIEQSVLMWVEIGSQPAG